MLADDLIMPSRAWIARAHLILLATVLALSLSLSACGATHSQTTVKRPSTTATTTTASLPGAGRPQITIGDKNYTEQFVLGELYRQALEGEGFAVNLNRNIGSTEVTMHALASGRIDMYPEYLGIWNETVAQDLRSFRTASGAYQAGQRSAIARGLALLDRTPFSDTDAIGVKFSYALQNGLNTIGDLRKVAQSLTLGGPPQFQQGPRALPGIEQAYGVFPSAFKALEVGEQYPALNQGTVQAADVNTTDGQLVDRSYHLLGDPRHVFGWGNVVPVVSAKILAAEGPAFAGVINKVSSLLSTPVMRELNAAVDVSHQDPAAVAKQFLLAHSLAVGPPS